MKKIFAMFIATIMCVMAVSAHWEPPVTPPPLKIPEQPSFQGLDLAEKVEISGLSGNLYEAIYAKGGWYWDGSTWSLQDLQHNTAVSRTTACTTGTEYYLNNYMPSGTEAEGTAWKLAAQSLTYTWNGDHELNNNVVAWTVNAVPPGGGYTKVFYEEMTGRQGASADHYLVVDGYAPTPPHAPMSISTHYESDDNLWQQKKVAINIP